MHFKKHFIATCTISTIQVYVDFKMNSVQRVKAWELNNQEMVINVVLWYQIYTGYRPSLDSKKKDNLPHFFVNFIGFQISIISKHKTLQNMAEPQNWHPKWLF